MTRRRRGGVKGRETDLASNQFPKCSPQPGTPKKIPSWVQKRRGREGIEVTWGERAIKPVITLLKMDTEDWILKGTKLITKIKKQRLKI